MAFRGKGTSSLSLAISVFVGSLCLGEGHDFSRANKPLKSVWL
jgi:hypothetical protein